MTSLEILSAFANHVCTVLVSSWNRRNVGTEGNEGNKVGVIEPSAVRVMTGD
jgi:hypothetical protein